MGTLSLKSFKGLSLQKQQELDKLKSIQQKTEQEAKEDQNNCRSPISREEVLEAMLEADYRYDLKGNISEPLSQEHKQDAKNRIERQHKKQKQK